MGQRGVEGYNFTPEQLESEISDLEAAAAGLVAGIDGVGGEAGSEVPAGDRVPTSRTADLLDAEGPE